jgi:hypothetical protein
MVSFGGTTYTSNSQDSGYVETAHTIPTTGVNIAFNSTYPIKITQVRTYVGSYDGVGNIVASIGGFSGTYSSVGINSSPGLSGWLTVSGSFVNAGTATTFRLDPSTGGGVYFKRSGSGTTTKSTGYVWAGTMYGEYLFIEVPGAPTSFLATPSGTAGLVNFSWTAPADNGGSAITGYDIYRGTTSGTVTTLIGSTTGATTFSYTAPNATNYHYHVRAKNAVSTAASTTSVASNVDTAQAAFDPNDAIPKNFTATPHSTSGRIDLAWDVPVSPPAATYGYKIFQNGVLIHTITISSNPDETYSVTGLTPGVEYSFYVKTTSSLGDTGQSNSDSAVAPGFAIAPSSVSVTSVNTVVATSVEVVGQLRISWTAPPGMTSSGGYKIYRDGTQIAGVGVSESVIGNMTSPFYIDNGLTPGELYSYTIQAYLASSSEVGTISAPVSGIPSGVSVQLVTDTVNNLTNADFAGSFDNVVTVVDPTTFRYPVAGATDYTVQGVDSGVGTVSGSLLEIFDTDFSIASVTSTALTFSYASDQPSTASPVSITSAVTNKTNAALSGTYVIDASTVNSGTATVFYVKDDPVLSADILSTATTGTVNNLDAGTLNANPATIVSVPSASSFTYILADVADLAETDRNGTVFNIANDGIYNGVAKTITSVPRYDEVTFSSVVPDSGPTSEDLDIEFPEETARRTSSTASAEVQYRSGWIG